MRKTFTTNEVAEIFGVTPTRIRQWGANLGCPKVGRGVWDLKSVVEWYISREREKTQKTGEAAGGVDLDDSKSRYWAAKADRERAAVDRLKGKLIDRNEVIRAWTVRVVAVTSGLEMLSKRLPPLLVGKGRREIAAIIEREVRSLRKEYARGGKLTPKTKEERK